MRAHSSNQALSSPTLSSSARPTRLTSSISAPIHGAPDRQISSPIDQRELVGKYRNAGSSFFRTSVSLGARWPVGGEVKPVRDSRSIGSEDLSWVHDPLRIER